MKQLSASFSLRIHDFYFEMFGQKLIPDLCLCGPAVFHFSQRFTTVVPESCMLILLGLVLGGVVLIANKKQLYQLEPALFFLFLLPTIVGDAGYFMPARLFFDNLGAILTYAVVGTLWNAFCTGFCLYAAKLLGVIGQCEVTSVNHVLCVFHCH